MFCFILLLFVAAFGLIIWATHSAIVGRFPTLSRWLYLGAVSASVVTAYFTTFHYSYLANANTRFHGWPVPTVIFQRKGPDEPWLDFVGPTVILAFPMNLVLFASIPALIVSVVYWFRIRSRTSSNDAPDTKVVPSTAIQETANSEQVEDRM